MSGLRVLELTDPRWEKFVARQSSATPFHHPDWARLIADCEPAPVTDGIAGHLLASVIRHGPPVPCRTAGEALYRYGA